MAAAPPPAPARAAPAPASAAAPLPSPSPTPLPAPSPFSLPSAPPTPWTMSTPTPTPAPPTPTPTPAASASAPPDAGPGPTAGTPPRSPRSSPSQHLRTPSAGGAIAFGMMRAASAPTVSAAASPPTLRHDSDDADSAPAALEEGETPLQRIQSMMSRDVTASPLLSAHHLHLRHHHSLSASPAPLALASPGVGSSLRVVVTAAGEGGAPAPAAASAATAGPAGGAAASVGGASGGSERPRGGSSAGSSAEASYGSLARMSRAHTASAVLGPGAGPSQLQLSIPMPRGARKEFKVLLLGDSGSGKRSLARHASYGISAAGDGRPAPPNVGVERFQIRIEAPRANPSAPASAFPLAWDVVDLDLWCCAGQERFKTVTSTCYLHAHAVLLCYDVSKRSSFDAAVGGWFSDVCRMAPSTTLAFLVGCKADLRGPREADAGGAPAGVPAEEARAKAEEMRVHFRETSAASGLNVSGLFTVIAQALAESRRARTISNAAQQDGDVASNLVSHANETYLSATGRLSHIPLGTLEEDSLESVAGGGADVGPASPSQPKPKPARAEGAQGKFVACPLKCGAVLRPGTVEEHTVQECWHRLVTCSLGCGARMSFLDMVGHEREFCPERGYDPTVLLHASAAAAVSYAADGGGGGGGGGATASGDSAPRAASPLLRMGSSAYEDAGTSATSGSSLLAPVPASLSGDVASASSPAVHATSSPPGERAAQPFLGLGAEEGGADFPPLAAGAQLPQAPKGESVREITNLRSLFARASASAMDGAAHENGDSASLFYGGAAPDPSPGATLFAESPPSAPSMWTPAPNGLHPRSQYDSFPMDSNLLTTTRVVARTETNGVPSASAVTVDVDVDADAAALVAAAAAATTPLSASSTSSTSQAHASHAHWQQQQQQQHVHAHAHTHAHVHTPDLTVPPAYARSARGPWRPTGIPASVALPMVAHAAAAAAAERGLRVGSPSSAGGGGGGGAGPTASALDTLQRALSPAVSSGALGGVEELNVEDDAPMDLRTLWFGLLQTAEAKLPVHSSAHSESDSGSWEDFGGVIMVSLQDRVVPVKKIAFRELTLTPECAGSGSFGSVYIGQYRGASVAVKRLHAQEVNEEDLKREAAVMASVSGHPHTLRFIGVCLERPYRCFVSEALYCSLEKHLYWSQDDHAEPLKEVVRYMLEAASGVLHLHLEQVVHRDLAARNLLLDHGSPRRVKVCDFGLARVLPPRSVNGTVGSGSRNLAGPLRWMAPESLRPEHGMTKFSFASDVYSFGITAYELLSRDQPYPLLDAYEAAFAVWQDGLRPPRAGMAPERAQALAKLLGPPHLRPAVARLVALLEACWAHDPAARPTMREVVDQLVSIKSMVM